MSDQQLPPLPPTPDPTAPSHAGGPQAQEQPYAQQQQYAQPAQQPFAQQQPAQAQPPLQAPYGSPAPAWAPQAGSSSNPGTPGRIGFIIGLVGLGISLLVTVLFQLLIHSEGWMVLSMVSRFTGILTFLAAVAALVFGIIGLRRVGAPQAQAGIAVGLGIAGTASGLFAFLASAMNGLPF